MWGMLNFPLLASKDLRSMNKQMMEVLTNVYTVA